MKLQIGQVGRTQHLPTRVAAQITTEIMEGRLQPGDRLPTENELAEACGVSRNVVREAIARLRSDGVVESRQGVGAFVMEPARRSTIRIEAGSLQDRENLERLYELRGLLEIDTAGLAAMRRDTKHLQLMHKSVERMRKTEDWSVDGVDADLEFHHAVAAASGNSYVERFVIFLSEQVRETIVAARKGYALDEIVEITIGEHEAIVTAIEAEDPPAAIEAMRAHIKGAAHRLGIDVCTRPERKSMEPKSSKKVA
jgi:GntR family transcriptional regulator, transcriptional repressor for pyruvate dehydrogenase complex